MFVIDWVCFFKIFDIVILLFGFKRFKIILCSLWRGWVKIFVMIILVVNFGWFFGK